MHCSVGHSLHSRINQQGKKLVITGFIQNITSREFLGGKGSLPIHSPLTPQLQNRIIMVQFSSVTQSCLTLCDSMNCRTPGLPTIINSWSLLELMSIESVMPSSHLIFCRPLLLLSPIPPSIRVLSKESTPCMRWPPSVQLVYF